jgi:hypothetical protein
LRSEFVPDAASAANLALVAIEAADVVLIKGSRGVRTEQVAQALVRAHAGSAASPARAAPESSSSGGAR